MVISCDNTVMNLGFHKRKDISLPDEILSAFERGLFPAAEKTNTVSYSDGKYLHPDGYVLCEHEVSTDILHVRVMCKEYQGPPRLLLLLQPAEHPYPAVVASSCWPQTPRRSEASGATSA